MCKSHEIFFSSKNLKLRDSCTVWHMNSTSSIYFPKGHAINIDSLTVSIGLQKFLNCKLLNLKFLMSWLVEHFKVTSVTDPILLYHILANATVTENWLKTILNINSNINICFSKSVFYIMKNVLIKKNTAVWRDWVPGEIGLSASNPDDDQFPELNDFFFS